MREKFIQNNLFLVGVLFGIMYLVTLFSTGWGIVLLMAIVAGLYYFAGKSSDESVLNKDIKKLFKRAKKEASNVDIKKITEDAREGLKNRMPEKADDVTTQSVEPIEVNEPWQETNKQGSLGMTLLLLSASVMALAGLFVSGFIQNTSISLFELLNQAVNGMQTYESITSAFGVSNNNMTGQLQVVMAVLVIVPMIVGLLSIWKRKGAYAFALLLSIIEVVVIVMVYSQLPSITTRFMSEYMSLGMPGYMLVIGAIGMVVLSFIGLFVQGKRKTV